MKGEPFFEVVWQNSADPKTADQSVWTFRDQTDPPVPGNTYSSQRKAIKEVAMDMWDPFINAVRDKLPRAKIMFDLFYVVANFNRVIDKVRNREYRKASKDDKAVYKGAKYLLLKN